MSFYLTWEAHRRGLKDVTRRNGWLHAKDGDWALAVQKSRGVRIHERVVDCPINFLEVTREPLTPEYVTPFEVRREGFPGMAPEEFIELYLRFNGPTPDGCVTRIHYLREPSYGSAGSCGSSTRSSPSPGQTWLPGSTAWEGIGPSRS